MAVKRQPRARIQQFRKGQAHHSAKHITNICFQKSKACTPPSTACIVHSCLSGVITAAFPPLLFFGVSSSSSFPPLLFFGALPCSASSAPLLFVPAFFAGFGSFACFVSLELSVRLEFLSAPLESIRSSLELPLPSSSLFSLELALPRF